jgi:hypothetical protein
MCIAVTNNERTQFGVDFDAMKITCVCILSNGSIEITGSHLTPCWTMCSSGLTGQSVLDGLWNKVLKITAEKNLCMWNVQTGVKSGRTVLHPSAGVSCGYWIVCILPSTTSRLTATIPGVWIRPWHHYPAHAETTERKKAWRTVCG